MYFSDFHLQVNIFFQLLVHGLSPIPFRLSRYRLL